MRRKVIILRQKKWLALYLHVLMQWDHSKSNKIVFCTNLTIYCKKFLIRRIKALTESPAISTAALVEITLS